MEKEMLNIKFNIPNAYKVLKEKNKNFIDKLKKEFSFFLDGRNLNNNFAFHSV